MKTGFARFTRDSAVFAMGAVAGKAIGFLLLPIVTRFLGPEDFGRFDLLATLGSALITILLLGFDAAVVRLYFLPSDSAHRGRLMATWFVIAAVIVIPVAVVLVALAGPLSSVLFGTTAYASAIALTAVVLVAGTFQYLVLTALRVAGRAPAYAIVSAGTLALNAVLVVVILGTTDTGVAGAILAYAVSLTAAALIGGAIIRSQFFDDAEGPSGRNLGRPSTSVMSRIAHLGLPLAIPVALVWVAEVVDRLILLAVNGPAEVGYFSVAVRYASVAGLVVGGFQLAWLPRAYDLGSSRPALVRLGSDGRRIVIIVSAAAAVVALVAPEAIALLAGDLFIDALAAAGPALAANIGIALFLVVSLPSALAAAMREVAVATAVGVVATVAATFLLAGPAGAFGAATALLLGQLVAVAVAGLYGRRHAAPAVAWPRTLAFAGVATVVIIIATSPVGASLVVRGLAGAGMLVVMFFEGTLADAARWAREQVGG